MVAGLVDLRKNCPWDVSRSPLTFTSTEEVLPQRIVETLLLGSLLQCPRLPHVAGSSRLNYAVGETVPVKWGPDGAVYYVQTGTVERFSGDKSIEILGPGSFLCLENCLGVVCPLSACCTSLPLL